ncbi:Fur family transcriptional regulator [Devriesea agamarum]|uniref:Fur family transcriptional regulator n=1 Tax=Devriesea agamarum TaxID=472569 RepID=UPI00071E0FCB|nr:transcriptional repressor [Devriesea agamarum]
MQRTTKQRTAILSALADADDFLTAQQLHELMKQTGQGVGLATVYRNLTALASAGLVDVLRTDDGESIYRQCDAGGHHHHLVCRRCGATVEFTAEPMESWADNVAGQHGFTDIRHTMEIFGLCPACSAS